MFVCLNVVVDVLGQEAGRVDPRGQAGPPRHAQLPHGRHVSVRDGPHGTHAAYPRNTTSVKWYT